MKTLEIDMASEPLSTYAKELVAGEILVLTANEEPVAAVVSLRHVDPEPLALSTSPEFLELIESARQEFKSGRKLSLSEMKSEVASMN
ncbi:MAG: hypothetical protein ACE5F6_15925 [Anaerolineae bacterium]